MITKVQDVVALKRLLSISIFFIMAQAANAACPSDVIQPFIGTWIGKAVFISAQGGQQQSGTQDEFAIQDCQTFAVTINYLDGAGRPARVLALKATPDSSGALGLFAVEGTITEGVNVSRMIGTFRFLQASTLLGSFSGAIGGQTAFLNELMNLTTLPNGKRQLVRTVQTFSGERGGAYLGTRVVYDSLR